MDIITAMPVSVAVVTNQTQGINMQNAQNTNSANNANNANNAQNNSGFSASLNSALSAKATDNPVPQMQSQNITTGSSNLSQTIDTSSLLEKLTEFVSKLVSDKDNSLGQGELADGDFLQKLMLLLKQLQEETSVNVDVSAFTEPLIHIVQQLVKMFGNEQNNADNEVETAFNQLSDLTQNKPQKSADLQPILQNEKPAFLGGVISAKGEQIKEIADVNELAVKTVDVNSMDSVDSVEIAVKADVTDVANADNVDKFANVVDVTDTTEVTKMTQKPVQNVEEAPLIQDTQIKQAVQSMQSTQSTQSTQDIQNIQNVQNVHNAQNVQNMQNVQNTQNTQNMQNMQVNQEPDKVVNSDILPKSTANEIVPEQDIQVAANADISTHSSAEIPQILPTDNAKTLLEALNQFAKALNLKSTQLTNKTAQEEIPQETEVLAEMPILQDIQNMKNISNIADNKKPVEKQNELLQLAEGLKQKAETELPQGKTVATVMQTENQLNLTHTVYTQERIEPKESIVENRVITQISDEIVKQLTTINGKSEFTMVLNPESLGKITVKLISEGGKLTVGIIAENQTTQQLLNSRAEHLETVLRQNDVQLENYQVVTQEQNLFSQDYNGSSKNPYKQQQETKTQDDESSDEFKSFMELFESIAAM